MVQSHNRQEDSSGMVPGLLFLLSSKPHTASLPCKTSRMVVSELNMEAMETAVEALVVVVVDGDELVGVLTLQLLSPIRRHLAITTLIRQSPILSPL